MGSEEYNRRWKLFFNGMVQAAYSGVISAFAVTTINGVFMMAGAAAMSPASMGMVVLGTVIGHLVGYFQRSPLPDLFEVSSPAKLVEVAEVMETADKKIIAVAEKANEDIRDIVDK